MAALTSAGNSMSLDDAPSPAQLNASVAGMRIFGIECTVDMVILVKALPILLVVVFVSVVGVDGPLFAGVVMSLGGAHASESLSESVSLLLVATRFRLLNAAGDVVIFAFKLVADLLTNRRGGEGLAVATAELVSLSLCEQAEQHDVLVELDTSAAFFLSIVLWCEVLAGDDLASVAAAGDGVVAAMANFMRRPPVSELDKKIKQFTL